MIRRYFEWMNWNVNDVGRTFWNEHKMNLMNHHHFVFDYKIDEIEKDEKKLKKSFRFVDRSILDKMLHRNVSLFDHWELTNDVVVDEKFGLLEPTFRSNLAIDR